MDELNSYMKADFWMISHLDMLWMGPPNFSIKNFGLNFS